VGGVLASICDLTTSGTVIFSYNVATTGGGIHIARSTVIFNGSTEFLNNSAKKEGGGMSIFSTAVTVSSKHLIFNGNSASKGGAIFIKDYKSAYQFHLLYISKTPLWTKLIHCRRVLKNRTAVRNDTVELNIRTSHDPHKIMTKTVIDLREPLMET